MRHTFQTRGKDSVTTLQLTLEVATPPPPTQGRSPAFESFQYYPFASLGINPEPVEGWSRGKDSVTTLQLTLEVATPPPPTQGRSPAFESFQYYPFASLGINPEPVEGWSRGKDSNLRRDSSRAIYSRIRLTTPAPLERLYDSYNLFSYQVTKYIFFKICTSFGLTSGCLKANDNP